MPRAVLAFKKDCHRTILEAVVADLREGCAQGTNNPGILRNVLEQAPQGKFSQTIFHR